MSGIFGVVCLSRFICSESLGAMVEVTYHRQKEGPRMADSEPFFFELHPIDGFASPSCNNPGVSEYVMSRLLEIGKAPSPDIKSPPAHQFLPYGSRSLFNALLASGVSAYPLPTKWKEEPLYHRGFPDVPIPFSPVHSAPVALSR
jgi:hypothetical protein